MKVFPIVLGGQADEGLICDNDVGPALMDAHAAPASTRAIAVTVANVVNGSGEVARQREPFDVPDRWSFPVSKLRTRFYPARALVFHRGH